MDIPSTSKRCRTNSGPQFKEAWEEEYFFIKPGDVLICLLCRKQLNQLKKYNLQRHYKTYHDVNYVSYTEEERKNKVQALKMKVLEEMEDSNDAEEESINDEGVLEVSYKIAYEIGKTTWPFAVGDLIKSSMVTAGHHLFPNAVRKIEALSLSRSSITRRIKEMAENIMDQISTTSQKFIAYSLALDESTDVSGTPQLAIFIRGVDSEMNINEELLDFCATNGTTGEHILSHVEEVVERNQLQWHNLVSVATDGAMMWIAELVCHPADSYDIATGSAGSRTKQVWLWYGHYAIGIITLAFICDVMKSLIGEPRPHFLDTCKPREAENCSDQYVKVYTCTNTAESNWFVSDSSKSFPSGHAALSMYTSIFVVWYLQNRLPNRTFFLKPWLQCMICLWTVICSLSRIGDNRHHWWDVLAGDVIGFAFGVLTVTVSCHKFRLNRNASNIYSDPIENGQVNFNTKGHQSVKKLLHETTVDLSEGRELKNASSTWKE